MFENKLTLPVLIIAVTLTLMTAFQMRQVLVERKLVADAFAGQEQPLSQAKQVGAQFESLAVGTARLAGNGNATAQGIVADLKRIGITVNPNATPGQSAIERHEPEQQQQAPQQAPMAAPGATAPTPPTNSAPVNNTPPAPPAGN